MKSQHIHFLGIAGIGVSALAQVALARHIRVSGSDPHVADKDNSAIRRLLQGGATLYTDHREKNLAEDVDLLVASAAVPEDNPEIQAARQRGVRVISRAEFLGELMAAHQGPKIAVAGTHGKTTTTGMIGVMLQHAGLDPTVFVGGEVPQLGGNVRIGSPTGPFVAEACEAYDSFLSLKPDIAVLTNIEADHLDHYGTLEGVMRSFMQFFDTIPRQGSNGVVMCADDPNVTALVHRLAPSYHCYRYGIESPNARSRAENIVLDLPICFNWTDESSRRRLQAHITLHVPGRHNVLNGVAAATVGNILELSSEQIAAGLAEFRGAGRRQEIMGEVALNDGTVLVMDDYAHHPTEIRATLDALRSAYPDRRLVAIFQPHLYSRTRDFLPEFADALSRADALIVTDIYAAREAPIADVRAADIVNRVAESGTQIPAIFLPDKQDIPNMLRALALPGDLAVFLGAGDIREQGEAFLQLLQQESNR